MAWKKSALKHSQTFSRARFEFMDMLLGSAKNALQIVRLASITALLSAQHQ
jgi:hypothetical protein